jgi:predicted small lipoprotein YifL
MRATVTAAMLAALLALAGCGNSSPPDAAVPPPVPEVVETTAEDPVAEEPVPEEPVAPALSLSCNMDTDTTYPSLKAAWADTEGSLYSCSVTINPDTYTFTDKENEAAQAYLKSGKYYGEDGQTGALQDLLAVCAARDEDVTTLLDDDPEQLSNALRICPRAPQAPLMRTVLAGRVFADGDLTVGKDVKAGTYRTEKEMHNCYWERTTKGGDTIANDFVTFAAKGVTVTIRSSDGGFSSKECGTWTRVP